jgi:predicted transcriptional regulator
MASRKKPVPSPLRSEATEAELRLLEALWVGGAQNVREISRCALGRDPANAAEYATIQSLLDRLERKLLVARDRSSVPHEYRAAVDRDAYIGAQLEAVASRTTGGALVPLLMNLVRRTKLTAEQRRRLLDLVDGGAGGAERQRGGRP